MSGSRGARVTALIGKRPRSPPPKDINKTGERRSNIDTRFKKGEVHNPGGRPAVVRELRDAAQAEGLNCIQTLIAIRDNPTFPPITRIAACNSLLDRGYGRPMQALAIAELPQLPAPGQVTKQMNHEEAAQLYASTLNQGRRDLEATMIEATAIEVTPEQTHPCLD